MKTPVLVAALSAAALLTGAIGQQARAQFAPAGTVYAFHSAATGSCPVLDWHLVSGGNGQLTGMVSWDGMKSMAHVTGAIGADRMIKMTATGAKGGTATVTGDAHNDGWLILNIKGTHIDCQDIKVPIWRSSGGTQSGGGG